MFCNKCGNELKEDDVFCNKCGASVTETTENEGVKKKKTKIIIVVSVVICVIAVLGICVYGYFYTKNKESNNINKDETVKTNSANLENTTVKSEKEQTVVSDLSFSNMKSDDDSFNEVQKEILKYFDDNYFFVWDYEDLQRYPKAYKGAQINLYVVVGKVLKSTDDEYEILAYFDSSNGYETENVNKNNKLIIKGKQTDERLIAGDSIEVYGRYIDISTYQIDGNTETLPTINVINTIAHTNANERRFNLETITTVAKYIFGNDIKIRKPVCGEDYQLSNYYIPESFFYMITLDNQSNSNFKCFDIFQDYPYIGYNLKYNDLSSTVVKKLFVGADFQHYIVTTYDKGTKHIYIDYFDKEYNKIWGREFNYTSNMENIYSPMDYDLEKMSIVVDNDLYLIDLATGENIIEPILVGNKISIVMYTNEMLLIGNDNKDAIMRVGYDGRTLKKYNADTSMELITAANIQLVDKKIVINIIGNKGQNMIDKYIIINENGEIELSTKDKNLF